MKSVMGWHGAARLAACGILLALCDCVSSGPVATNASVRRVNGIDRQNALDVAEDVLRARDYHIQDRDDRAGVIKTKPVEGVAAVGDRGVSRLQGRGKTRQVVEVSLAQDGSGTRIHCKVVVQEQDTQSLRMFSREKSGHDTYSDTPIDRDAATTDEQNTYWQTVRRDRVAEREILAEVLTRLGVVSEPNP